MFNRGLAPYRTVLETTYKNKNNTGLKINRLNDETMTPCLRDLLKPLEAEESRANHITANLRICTVVNPSAFHVTVFKIHLF